MLHTFARAIVDTAPIHSRKSLNRFLRRVDRWSNRLYRKGLIDLAARQDIRRHIAGAIMHPTT
ncbi:hypothetical protein SAMN05660463_00842 [Pseudomonas sp. URIL14HWK12:I9]|nr:hypothetical protein F474_00562 [Pseudomonas sp. URIL14HWK12:I12]PVZ27037.1 hypothetical protein F470_00217 [Pseudomonas sp. URIL14HWK12:I10]PVZ37926.1 hypothetical protein F472_00562 [Pseudomonas sp. URIL14HWK12:I11]SNZ05115.1 hypothetical protein SAMN05660463_00842 [Pseudomonas sp. URIL14HWK12:I9]